METIALTRLAWGDVYREALAGMVQRPTRTLLTMLGTVLGIGAFVTVIGLTATVSGQIASDFSVLKATQVTIADAGANAQSPTVLSFPDNAEADVSKLNGVVAAGLTWSIGGGDPVGLGSDGTSKAVQLPISAASPGYFQAAGSSFAAGVAFNDYHQREALPVAVMGAGAARQLGVESLANEPSVIIRGTTYSVIGILSNMEREPAAVGKVFIPSNTALNYYGKPDANDPATMLVATRIGAATLVAQQAPIALRPDQPRLLKSVSPRNVFALEKSVTGSLTSLFLALSLVTLGIGGVGIANTTLVAVMERAREIGLRRAVGARPRDIASQIVCETGAIGALGGLIGTALGVTVVLSVSLAQSWTALVDPAITLTAPLIGALVGVAAGIYPAWRAARVQPIDALRR